MQKDLEQLLMLATGGVEPEAAICTAVIDWIDSLLVAQDISRVGRLSNVLRPYTDVPSSIILDEYPRERVKAIIDLIVSVLEDSDSVPYLLNRLTNLPRDYEAYCICILLGWFGAGASVAVPLLVGFADGGITARVAKQAIVRIGNAETEILSALRGHLTFNDADSFREISVLAIQAGAYTKDDFHTIMEMASQSIEPEIRCETAIAIGYLDNAQKQRFIPILDHLANDGEEFVRIAAISAARQSESS